MQEVLEKLTLQFAPALAKAVLKLWLPPAGIVMAGAETLIDMLKKRGETFATIDATDRLFRNLASEVASRLEKLIESEFPRVSIGGRLLAVEAVATVLDELDLSRDMMRADLNAVGLEKLASVHSPMAFAHLNADERDLAALVLRESCAYVISLAMKLPDLQVASTRELLKRTSELTTDLTHVLDVLASIRERTVGLNTSTTFETQYRRMISQRLDRMKLFGVRLVGAGAREPEISIAYVTLTATRGHGARPQAVDSILAGLRRIVVRGEAGSGKTTLMQWLAIRAASRTFTGDLEPWNCRVPFYVYLREYAAGPFPTPERLVSTIAANAAALMPPGWAYDALAGDALLIIDGIDELPGARRAQLHTWIQDFTEDFPDCLIVLSSRPAALDATLDGVVLADRLSGLGFDQLRLEAMRLPDSEALVRKWHEAVGRDLVGPEDQANVARYERDLVRTLHDRPAIRSLASNPLLCSMICALNWDRKQRLPDDRMQLYGLALEMLIESRDAQRGVGGAHVASLSTASKEDLLDSIAHWMMRNRLLEAKVEDVLAQIGLLSRLAMTATAEEVLQELLERSGVLRQPQVGHIDFVHRTFLEYMAARSAVTVGDLGALAERAHDDYWRETIVFAVGHARGAQRDQLVARLLKTPLFVMRGLPREADVTAACCLETAAPNLDPTLLRKLRERASRLFPPTNNEAARILAPAARLDPKLLMNHEALGSEVVVACIHCAATTGGEAMLDVIASYASCSLPGVWEETIASWSAFDEEEYLERVVRKREEQDLGGLRLPDLDTDSLRCLQALVLNGMHQESTTTLSAALVDFIASRVLAIGMDQVWTNSTLEGGPSTEERSRRGHRERFRVRESDAYRLGAIRSIESLHFGPTARGVLKVISRLPSLKHLTCSPEDSWELEALAQSDTLVSLTVDDRSLRSFNRLPMVFDLRVLTACKMLRRLTVVHTAGTLLPLPMETNLEELCLIDVPPIASPNHYRQESASAFNLQQMVSLRRLTLQNSTSSLALPPRLKAFVVDGCAIELQRGGELAHLETLTLKRIRKSRSLDELLSAPRLKRIETDRDSLALVSPDVVETIRKRDCELVVLDEAR